MPQITLYEFAPTRSARCRWTLLELDVEYESKDGRQALGSDDYAAIHPLRKMPAVIVEGQPLFESAAICTYLADIHADRGLVARPGTRARALHDQWVSFTLSELEAPLWATQEQMLSKIRAGQPPGPPPALPELSRAAFSRAAGVVDAALADHEYLVDDRFTVTDIILGYAINGAAMMGLLEDHPHVQAYRDRLLARPHCTLMRTPPAM